MLALLLVAWCFAAGSGQPGVRDPAATHRTGASAQQEVRPTAAEDAPGARLAVPASSDGRPGPAWSRPSRPHRAPSSHTSSAARLAAPRDSPQDKEQPVREAAAPPTRFDLASDAGVAEATGGGPTATTARASTAAPADATAREPEATARSAAIIATVEPSAGSADLSETELSLSPREAELLRAINLQRVAVGLPALMVDDVLTDLARARSQDMVATSYFAHISPSGESWLTLLQAAGVRVAAGGENLAKVGGDVERSVDVAIAKLMASSTHRANILSPLFSRVGVGAVAGDDGVMVFTTIFTDG
jgi:uncharacterized protein YkwD